MSVPLENVSRDGMVELWLKIIQVGCPVLQARSKIMCGPPHKKFAHTLLYAEYYI